MNTEVSSRYMVKTITEKGLLSGVHVPVLIWIVSLWILCLVLSETVFAESAGDRAQSEPTAAFAEEEGLSGDLAAFAEEEGLSGDLAAFAEEEGLSGDLAAFAEEEGLSGDLAAFAMEEGLSDDLAAFAGEEGLSDDLAAFAQEETPDTEIAAVLEEENPDAELTASAGENDSTIDFVLVLDNSGTMARSDPDGLTTAAAMMFIDMLPTKNARVAVVEFGSNYGENAYSPEKYTNYVSVPFPLSDISSIEQRDACKQVISQTTQDGDYTPVGYAFQAACDVLEKGGAAPGNAGILLISDFRITGQKKEDFLEDGYSYQSLEDAERIAAENEWQVYTLEMNFDGKNDQPGDYTERIAARVRSMIPETVGYGDYVPLHDADEAQTRFADIFQLFFDPGNQADSEVQIRTTDENGIAIFPFTVGEMVAELNVTLTSPDSHQIQSLEIGRGDQMTTYDLTSYQEPIQEEYRTITKEDRYITIKLMLPAPGEDWKVVVHGEARTELEMHALSIYDMEFRLEALTAEQMNAAQGQPENGLEQSENGPGLAKAEADEGNAAPDLAPQKEADEGNASPGLAQTEADEGNAAPEPAETEEGSSITVSVNSPIHFTAAYLYDGRRYSYSKVYEAFPAALEIVETGEQIPMVMGDTEYYADISFLREGTYTVKAIASGETFRTGSIETGTLGVTVVSAPPQIPAIQIANQILDQVLEPGHSLEVNCAEFFFSPDGTPLSYQITVDPASSDLNVALEGDLATITAGAASGKYTVTIAADDGSGDPERVVAQSFGVEVPNRPLELVGEETISATIRLGKDAEQEIRINWADHFQDPDGFTPVAEVTEVNQDNAVVMTQDESGITLRGDHAGKAIYAVTVRDANDPSVTAGIQIKVAVEGSSANAKSGVSLPAIAILAAGAALIVLVIVLLWRRFH